MVSSQKVEENRPLVKFKFSYWEVLTPVYNLHTPCIHHYTMYIMLVSSRLELLVMCFLPLFDWRLYVTFSFETPCNPV